MNPETTSHATSSPGARAELSVQATWRPVAKSKRDPTGPTMPACGWSASARSSIASEPGPNDTSSLANTSVSAAVAAAAAAFQPGATPRLTPRSTARVASASPASAAEIPFSATTSSPGRPASAASSSAAWLAALGAPCPR